MSECESTKCTPDAMALYDARQWNNYNACLLPQGSGTVSLNSESGIYTITITWNDERDSDTPDDSFIVEFQPGGDDDGGSLAGEPDVPEEPAMEYCGGEVGEGFKTLGQCVASWVPGITGEEAQEKCKC